MATEAEMKSGRNVVLNPVEFQLAKLAVHEEDFQVQI